ncbi:sensor histidine kinase, partial [[Clostridium] leptum]
QYIFLQQTRLKNTFSCQIIVPPELLDCLIHKLIFQPFVENAILHGFEGVQQHHILIIEIQEKPKELLNITIHDNGKGIEAAKVEEIKQGILPDNKSKNHLGMKNAIDRLKMYYGEDAEFIIESQEGKGTTIVIRIPKTQGRE